jgi:hypothetical protein
MARQLLAVVHLPEILNIEIISHGKLKETSAYL